ncbi:MAG: hypothetical protein H7Y43_11680 [Akkermansiaceae bacterium]|nr:hypothetical protein [Verrucomicrobiales bacterium]
MHLNPVRARLLKAEESLSAYPWSSWQEYLKSRGKRPSWLRVDRVMGEWRVSEDNAAGRRQLERGMETRKELEMSKVSEDWKKLRRGWCWGPKGFREELLEMIGEKEGSQHHGKELKEWDEQKARMAERLRKETTMGWQWIAKRLEMGHWRTSANAV